MPAEIGAYQNQNQVRVLQAEDEYYVSMYQVNCEPG